MTREIMETAIKELGDHLGIIVVLVVGGWWMATKAGKTIAILKDFVGHEIEERVPRILKRELANGLGDLIEARMRNVVAEHAKEEYERMNEEFRELRYQLARQQPPRIRPVTVVDSIKKRR